MTQVQITLKNVCKKKSRKKKKNKNTKSERNCLFRASSSSSQLASHCPLMDDLPYGVGRVLFRLSNCGKEQPIAYLSKKLNSAQKNYSVTEFECLAAIVSVNKFALHYLVYMPKKLTPATLKANILLSISNQDR